MKSEDQRRAKPIEVAKAQFEKFNAVIERRVGRNLFQATVAGIIFAAIFFASVLFGKIWFMLLLLIIAAFGGWELAEALRNKNVYIPRFLAAGTAAVVAVSGFWFGFLGPVIAGIIAVPILWWGIYDQRSLARAAGAAPANSGRDLLGGILILGYVGGLASFVGILTAQDGGELWVLAYIVTIALNDIAALGFGVSLGRHPMAPHISPKKSWEGFLGGVLVALIAGALLGEFLLGTGWGFGILFGIVLALVGTVGDLVESTIKRWIGIKDMGQLLPGHGGLLDRLDSILLAAPFTLLLYFLAVS